LPTTATRPAKAFRATTLWTKRELDDTELLQPSLPAHNAVVLGAVAVGIFSGRQGQKVPGSTAMVVGFIAFWAAWPSPVCLIMILEQNGNV